MTPGSYQHGSLLRRKRNRLPDVWEFRYRRYMADGTSNYVREVLGDVKQYPTRKAVMGLVEEARERINAAPKGIFFHEVTKRYKDEILPKLRPQTQTTNRGNVGYLEKAFGARRIQDITPGELDVFFNSLMSSKFPGQALSKTTRQHVKALTHHIWRQAMLWGYVSPQVNPVEITRVTEGAGPRVRSSIVSAEAYAKLLQDPELPGMVKTMMQVAMITGLRVSEIAGLKWEDIDFKNLVIHVRRSAVGKNSNDTKNPYSADDAPMHKVLAKALQAWKRAEPVWGGWVFGSPITERPYHAVNLQRKFLRPAGDRVGISHLGWHAFRHTHSADLEVAGASDRIQQASMRHGDAAMTRHYGKHSPALMEKMREAQDRVVSILQKKTGTRG